MDESDDFLLKEQPFRDRRVRTQRASVKGAADERYESRRTSELARYLDQQLPLLDTDHEMDIDRSALQRKLDLEGEILFGKNDEEWEEIRRWVANNPRYVQRYHRRIVARSLQISKKNTSFLPDTVNAGTRNGNFELAEAGMLTQKRVCSYLMYTSSLDEISSNVCRFLLLTRHRHPYNR